VREWLAIRGPFPHDVPAPRRREDVDVNSLDQDRLKSVCAEVVDMDPADLTAETDFFDDLNIDRDDLADLFVAVEEAFDISLERGVTQVRTFEDLEILVEDEIPA
jgi:acyl carrier protein